MDFEKERKALVKSLISNSAIKTEAVEKAFLKVKREIFFPENMRQFSYVDSAFSIGHGQTISQPYTIATMLELLDVKKGMKILEVGSGCGYVLALLQELTGTKGKVFGIEIVPELVAVAKENLEKAGYKNIRVTYGDGTQGFPEEKEFGRILISAARREIPEKLKESLAENGKLVAPVGNAGVQFMHLAENKKGKISEKDFFELGGFVFVPLKSNIANR